MNLFLIIVGILTMLIGFSIWWDDREYNRQMAIEEMHREDSPELYDDDEDNDFVERWGVLAPYVAFVVVGFYTVRGWVVLAGGAWLTVTGVG